MNELARKYRETWVELGGFWNFVKGTSVAWVFIAVGDFAAGRVGIVVAMIAFVAARTALQWRQITREQEGQK